MNKKLKAFNYICKIVFMITLLLSIKKFEVFASPELQVSIGTVKASFGQTIEIPVSLENIPSNGVDGFQFMLKYDSSVMEYIGISAGSSIPVPSDLDAFQKTLGNIRVLYCDSASPDNPIKNNGQIFLIKFFIKANAEVGQYNVVYDNSFRTVFPDIQLSNISAKFINGSVTVEKLQGDLNNDKMVDGSDLQSLSQDYSKSEGDSGYSSDKDLNGDGVIDIFDLVILSKKIK